ncbi:hypothetical protein LMUR_03167 [Listeria grayi FSL F6-1183]|uniref:Uncharacterized protein n=1 Tax=Listeria grayi FSL F6-1183 TaxID=1265827 RepID=A0A829RA82_LISGR|nr:hypothetical protein LMUR_03167 [Listeria grayi FSL F6-1183]
MSEKSNWKDTSEEVLLGKIEIAPEVIGVIAGLAASEVESVAPCKADLQQKSANGLAVSTIVRV